MICKVGVNKIVRKNITSEVNLWENNWNAVEMDDRDI